MIDIFFNILRKGLVATIALVFAFVIIYVPQEYATHHTVPETQAFFGTDLLNLVQNTIQAVAAVANKLKEFVLDGIAWTIAKAIVAKMVSSLVDWINNGFKGSPSFVTNFGKLLLDVADEEAGRFIEEQGGDASFLCEPFKLDIQIALAIEYENVREDKPYEGCKISDFIGSAEDFFKGNFEEGGWENWIRVTAEPEKYTPYGQTMEAEKTLAIKLSKAQAEKKTETDWGSGFQSVKSCEEITTMQSLKEDCTIVTPGKPIADSLTKSLGAGQDTLITADEISEIIGALFAQLANKAITGTKGLLGLTKGTGQTYSGYSGGSYTSAANSQADQLVTQAQNNTGNTPLSGTTTTTTGGNTTTGGTTPGTPGGVGGTGNISCPGISGPVFSTTCTTQSPAMADVIEGLTVQTDYLALANQKIPVLQAYIANTNNATSSRDAAAAALADAQAVQRTAPGYVSSITALKNKLAALETEIADPKTTDARKAQILVEEQAIADQIAQINAYTRAQYDASNSSWSQFR